MIDRKVILFIFAGRECNLTVQRPYLDRLLRDWPNLDVHLWDLTRNDEDHTYVQSLHDPDARVIVQSDLYEPNTWPKGICRRKQRRPRSCACQDCKPGCYEDVYRWYAEHGDPDAVYVKVDDDVLFLETNRFGNMFAVLDDHPNAVVSALVTNNVVSAKHDPELRAMVEASSPVETQRDWFDLHTSVGFARLCHDWFLDNAERLLAHRGQTQHERALPGERPSINTIAFTFSTLLRMVATMNNPLFRKMGDEGTVCNNFPPRIVTTFRTAHLQFGPQRIAMDEAEWDEYRARYAELAKAYLGE